MAESEEFQAGEELNGTLEGDFQGAAAGNDEVADAQAVSAAVSLLLIGGHFAIFLLLSM